MGVDDLSEEVDRLEITVDTLNTTVQNLTIQVDFLEDLNENFTEIYQQLNNSVTNLTEKNDQLEEQVDQLENFTDELNDQVASLNNETAELEEQVVILNLQVDELGIEIDELEILNSNLTVNNQELNQTVTNLTSQVISLEQTVDELEEANSNLTKAVQELRQETNELNGQIDRLESILLGLNETLPINQTAWDELLEDLEQIVDTNRGLVLTNLDLYYQGVVQAWRCDYPTDFSGRSFLENPTDPFGNDENYAEVITNVEFNILKELCLDVINYENYLKFTTGKSQDSLVTFNEIRATVTQYTDDALLYYFNNEAGGLTAIDWATAEYDCNKLTPEQRFEWIQE